MRIQDQTLKNTVQFSNHLKSIRTKKGLSQVELARRAGMTRQGLSAIESNLYLPTTAVALRLASVLDCRVEDLFSLAPTENIIEGTLIGHLPQTERIQPIRVKVSTVGKRTVVRPVTGLGEQFSFAVPADGYVNETSGKRSGDTVRVQLSRDREAIQQEISVAGCDPAIFLAGEHLRRQKDQTTVVGWTMGSTAALHALQRGDVHVAGLHLLDPVSGESNVPFLRRSLKGSGYEVVTFATWEEGFLVRTGNPKSIRTAADLAEPMVTLINREEGSGARLLLDQRLRAVGIEPTQVRGYDRIVSSHFDVARTIAERQADVGVGIRSAAQLFELDFVPLQAARYDLVVPKSHLKSHPTLTHLFETLVSRPFRNEIEALGGYDTSETGKVHALRVV
ncbi:substrate-binding domain-containing protein [Candidatus Nitrospira nitrificans]|uniref:Putative Transcriptional regulator ModE n=1 Tax=Candidatus Nitrospira nitrificans TaxID=1742973 RepID=A0A0S4L7A9_9BACT|nr:substrate-binding domain-containing protein [Candidatus Nitrospira nitrificans]CUS33587.1 putative Transcriptional regulator ModE [Candidatus Nitrospira nitrificans]